jgi:hypothetical protein
LPSTGSQPSPHPEDDDQDEADKEAGHGEAEKGDHLAAAVPPAADFQPREHAQRQADDQRNGECGQPELQRVGKALEIDLADRQRLLEGVAEVAAEQVADEAQVLRIEWTVETPIMPNLLQVGRIGADLALHLDRIAAEPDQRENDRHQQPQRDHAVEAPSEDVFLHRYSSALNPQPSAFTSQISHGHG